MMKKLFVISLLFIFGFIALAPDTLACHRHRRIAYRSNFYPTYYGAAYGNPTYYGTAYGNQYCSPYYGTGYGSGYYTTSYRSYGYPTYVRTYRSYSYPYYATGYRSYRTYSTPYYRVASTRYVSPYYQRHSRTRAILTVAAPAAIGAGIGALFGGGRGAGIGALLGGGGGAAYYLSRRHRY